MGIDLAEVSARESEQVEWKENVADVNDVVRALVAFANDLQNLGGGRVVCGAREVADEHGFPRVELVGLSAARLREVENQVLARCRDRVHPPIAPLVDELPGAGPETRVLVFTAVATGRAHAFRDASGSTYWVRLGRATREARNGLLLRLLSAKGEVEPWDRRPASGATVDDLDLLALRDGLTRMGAWDADRPIEHWLDPNVTMSSFVPSLCAREPLTGTVRPRNFALLLFGRAPQRWAPGAVAVFSRYAGPDRAEPYGERLDLDGTLPVQVRQLVERLDAEAVTLMDKSSGAPENVVKYPPRALQEAVVNAIVHRDYTSDAPVRVTAFSDRVEIWSPGGLDPRVDPEAFQAAKASPVWRNQALAWVFLKLRLAQNEGQGIPTIVRSMASEGCPPPQFDVSDAFVRTTLPAHPRHTRVHDLLQAERDLAAGRPADAIASLERLLAADPFNARTLLLLADAARAAGDDGAVVRFLASPRARLDRIPAAARRALAAALDGEATPDRAEWVRALLA